jgi:hypothetical protein
MKHKVSGVFLFRKYERLQCVNPIFILARGTTRMRYFIDVTEIYKVSAIIEIGIYRLIIQLIQFVDYEI